MSDDDKIATLIKKLKDLRVRETNLLRQIEEAHRQREYGRNNNGTHDRTYRKSDRVYITSRVRKPASAPDTWTAYNERRATVTRVVDERVFIRTDNGTETWRADKNIRLLPS